MRKLTLASVVSTALLGAAAAQAGGDKMSQEKITAADTDRDGSITLAEAQAGLPTLAQNFAAVDADSDGKISAAELEAYRKSHDKSMEADETTTPPTDK
jgi:Ca2+-binding EF-hand superfamily protein